MPRPHDIRRGALYVIGAAFAFAIMAALTKHLAAGMSNEMLVWARNLFAVVFLSPLLVRYPPQQWVTHHWRGHLVRATSGLLAMYCMFWAIPRLDLAEALLLNQTASLFIPFFAWLALGERVSVRTGVALAIGFTGIMLVLKPGAGVFTWAALVGLASGMLAAVSMVSIRSMAGVEPSTRVVMYFSVLATLGSTIPLFWAWQTPSLLEWFALAALGALAVTGQLLITRGYMSAPAAQVGPFTFSSVLFAALFGWLLWDESIDALSLYGGLLVIAAGILVVVRRWPRVLRRTPQSPNAHPVGGGDE